MIGPDPHDSSPRGFFLSLDGPDGGGKTTQAARLVAWLESTGREVVACREPGGTALGEKVRSILLDRGQASVGMRAELLLFMAARAQLVDEVIRPALEGGKIVVSDRFLLASVVYQGVAGGIPSEEIWRIGRLATGGILPDLTLVLDLPIDSAMARVGGPRDRLEDRPTAYREAVRRGYVEAADFDSTIRLIDASDGQAAVWDRIQREVADALGIDPRS